MLYWQTLFFLVPLKIRMSLFLHQIWRNVAFHHCLSNGCSAVNGSRQNESPNSWSKHHNNPQVMHTTPVHQLTSGEDKSWNKSIIKTFLTSNHCFRWKSIIHNDASSSEKVFWSESGEKSAQIKQRLQDKTALNKYMGVFWCERQQEMDFLTGGNVIMDYGLVF